MELPELNTSQRAILDLLKRLGRATVPTLAAELALNIETVRGHLKRLERDSLVRREGSLRDGPGRPEILFGLSEGAEELFPRREPQVLGELAAYLLRSGLDTALDGFFDEWIAERRSAALLRIEGLKGRARLEEIAAILSELGFMAVVDDDEDEARLRLCHCPLRGLVEATRMPCRVEIELVQELVGCELQRESYIPDGDPACSYRIADPDGSRVARPSATA